MILEDLSGVVERSDTDLWLNHEVLLASAYMEGVLAKIRHKLAVVDLVAVSKVVDDYVFIPLVHGPLGLLQVEEVGLAPQILFHHHFSLFRVGRSVDPDASFGTIRNLRLLFHFDPLSLLILHFLGGVGAEIVRVVLVPGPLFSNFRL